MGKKPENVVSDISDEKILDNEKKEIETNKLRAALGLPPMKTKSPKKISNENVQNKEADKKEQENNKLRAALGLPPLKTKSPKKLSNESDLDKESDTEEQEDDRSRTSL